MEVVRIASMVRYERLIRFSDLNVWRGVDETSRRKEKLYSGDLETERNGREENWRRTALALPYGSEPLVT